MLAATSILWAPRPPPSEEDELKPEARTWLAKLAAETAPSAAASREAALDRLLAAFALERPSDARPR